MICTYCGELIDPSLLPQHVQTRNLGENDTGENQPRWGTARFDDQTRLILRVTDSSHILHVDAHKPNGVILGRTDPESGRKPEVDLTMFEAMELGVSRRHARLDIHDESLYVTDLGSANSTYLNGLRLTAHQPRILRDSDEIRLGHLKLQVTFIEARTQTQKLPSRPLDVSGDLRSRDIAGTVSTTPPVAAGTEPEHEELTSDPALVEPLLTDNDTTKLTATDVPISKADTDKLVPAFPDLNQVETGELRPDEPVAIKEPEPETARPAINDDTGDLPGVVKQAPTAELKDIEPDASDLETADLRNDDEDDTIPTARLLTDLPEETEAKVTNNGKSAEG